MITRNTQTCGYSRVQAIMINCPRLPRRHDRAKYSLSWNAMLSSAGGEKLMQETPYTLPLLHLLGPACVREGQVRAHNLESLLLVYWVINSLIMDLGVLPEWSKPVSEENEVFL